MMHCYEQKRQNSKKSRDNSQGWKFPFGLYTPLPVYPKFKTALVIFLALGIGLILVPLVIPSLVKEAKLVSIVFVVYIYPLISLGLGALWVFGVWAKNKRDIFISVITVFLVFICLNIAWSGIGKWDSLFMDLMSGHRMTKEGVEVLSVKGPAGRSSSRNRSIYSYLVFSDDPSQTYWWVGQFPKVYGRRVNAEILPYSKGILSLRVAD